MPILFGVPSDTALLVPIPIRPVTPTSAAVKPGGATKRSAPLTTLPYGVETETRPEVAVRVKGVVTLVVVADVTDASVPLRRNTLLLRMVWKLVPAIVKFVPRAATGAEKLLMVGRLVAPTVKMDWLVPVPAGVVIEIRPLVAPAGTFATICVAVAEVTVAATPPNFTTFSLAVALMPVPEIVTIVPTGPASGANPRIDACAELLRDIERIFPTAS